MDLGLSLGESNKNAFEFLEKHKPREQMNKKKKKASGFCMGLSIGDFVAENENKQDESKQNHHQDEHSPLKNDQSDAPVQLIDLLPHTPVPRSHGFPWSSSENRGSSLAVTTVVEETEELGAALSSSPNSNSGASSFHEMDIRLYNNYIGNDGNRFKRDQSEGEGEGEGEGERGSSRASDEDDTNGSTRKKLRLSKDQSAFLEESFKEHNTLNPKQKLALAKQLNLRPRQVEVWFQNRRARTKLKQTEVDCEYLKRCCEKLTEENRRLNKELQELRALKTSNPFYMQLPATTLTMCPSCERVATSTTTTTTTTTNNNSTPNITSNTKQANNNSDSKAVGLSIPQNNRPKLFPFSHSQSQSQSQSHHSSAAS